MRILMTGATAGIGLETAKCLLAGKGVELVAGARSPRAAPSLLRTRAKLLDLDLASLDSVRAFASKAQDQAAFDVIVMNAGIQCVRPQISKDGYELTFAVNHLAHYLLARLLVTKLAQGGRIVLTASGTHDPNEKTGLPAPRHADANLLADPAKDPNRDKSAMTAGRRAYSTSKLCNIMTARELAKRMAATRPDLAFAAFDPGFTPGTGLARDYPGPTGLIFRYLLPLVVRRNPRVSTPQNSGRLLAAVASSPAYGAARGAYFAVRDTDAPEIQPSDLARNDTACAKLWDDSAKLVGLG